LQNLIQIPQDDKVRAIIDIKNFEDKDFVNSHYILLCTKKGMIKKTDLEDFSRPRQTGINAINILEGDQLIAAKLTDGNCEIMMAVNSGRAIRFPEEKVRSTGRGGQGVSGIEVEDEKDYVVGLACVSKDDTGRTILVVSEKGYGKRTPVEEYRITNRGGKGVKTINVTDKTGGLVGLLDVADKQDLMITCESGVTIRMKVNQISEQGRATQGVKLIRIDENDAIAAVAQIDDQEDVETIEDEAINNNTEVDKNTANDEDATTETNTPDIEA
jgi:DNA gyrase subunit A